MAKAMVIKMNGQDHIRHANIPLFIPHMGCPHNCIFCNQKTISGTVSFDSAKAEEQVKEALRTLGGRRAELAFFGGSFTAIPTKEMVALLEIGKKYLDTGELSGIRLSTRPDAVGEDILDILEEYGVTSIELGVQSMRDRVLQQSGRGHSVSDTEDAFARILRRNRFSLAGQMMLGLPGSSMEDEIYTARRIIEMGADSARIYPTVVLENTPLARLYSEHRYTPLSLEEGIRRGAEICEMFGNAGVKLLRLGLSAEEGFETHALAGCYHPAYGELVENALFLKEAERILSGFSPEAGEEYTVFVAKGSLSKAIGQKKRNKKLLNEKYGCVFTFKEDPTLAGREIAIRQNKEKHACD